MSRGRPPCILLSCGEPSGDVYAAHLARALRAARPEVRLVGVGGERLGAEGVPRWATLEQLSVMGFGEVLRHLPRLRRLGNELCDRAIEEGVDLLLAVDYPGFHVALARRLRARGVGCLHFIPPKTWSWGSWRLRGLRAAGSECAVIFPFEERYYGERGVLAHFVGHPLLDVHAATLAMPEGPREGLLIVPGSRQQELARVLPPVARALRTLRETGAVRRVKVSRAPEVDPAWLEPLRRECPDAEICEGPLLPLLRAARAAVVTSGTATLEAALARTPHGIVYRTSGPTYWVARALATVQHIGMANIVLGRRAVPELLQGGLTEASLVKTMRPLLEEGPEADAQRAAFDELRGRLGAGGAFENTAQLALRMLQERDLSPRSGA